MPFTAELQELTAEVHGLRQELHATEATRERERSLAKRVVGALVVAMLAITLTIVAFGAMTVVFQQTLCSDRNAGREGIRGAFDGYTDALAAVSNADEATVDEFRRLQEEKLRPIQPVDCGFLGSTEVEPWMIVGTAVIIIVIVGTALRVWGWAKELADEHPSGP